MYLRRFLVVVLLATTGMSSSACAQAIENNYLAATDSTVTATINGRKVLIDVPVGQTINLPAGTRLWPASPVVISRDAYPQPVSATPSNVRQQLPVVQYGQQQTGNARFHPRAGNEFHYTQNEFHRTQSEFHPTTTQTFQSPERIPFPAQSQSAGAVKRVANPYALNPVQPVISKNVVYPINVKEVAVDAPRALADTPKAELPLPTKPAPQLAEDTLTSFDSEERVEEQAEDDSIVSAFQRSESSEANEAPERNELEVTEERANETVDLYADAVDPSSTDSTFDEHELSEVFSAEVPPATTSIASESQASLEQREPESVSAEKGIQLFVGEPVTSVTPERAFTTTEEIQSDTTAPESALTEVTPGFVTEQTKAKSDLPWLLPVVFLSAIGLAWAERLRRNRSKVRFERAMEHGRRVQRLGDDEDSDTVVAPFSKLVKEAPPQNLKNTNQPSSQLPLTPPTLTLEQASALAADTQRQKTTAFEPVSTEPIQPFISDAPTLTREQTNVEPAIAPAAETDRTPVLPPVSAKPFITPSPEEFVVETVADLHAPSEKENTEPLEILDLDAEPESLFDAPERSNDRDWAGIMGYEPLAVKDSPDELMDFTTKAKFEHLGGAVPTETDAMIELAEENQDAVAQDVLFTPKSISERSVVSPQAEDAELPKMRDAEGKVVEEDLELDQLTGLLEDANTMRSEWAGFEQRAADFRERWIDRQPKVSEPDQSEA